MRNQRSPLEAPPLERIPNILAHTHTHSAGHLHLHDPAYLVAMVRGQDLVTGRDWALGLGLGLVRFVCPSPQTVNLFATHATTAAAAAAVEASENGVFAPSNPGRVYVFGPDLHVLSMFFGPRGAAHKSRTHNIIIQPTIAERGSANE